VAKSEQKQELDAAVMASSKVSMRDFVEMLNSPKRLAWLNFYTGFIRGLAGVVGAAIAVVLIGAAVVYLGGIPVIGEFIQKVGEAAGMTTVPPAM
jgi:hypothetical protein